MNSNCPNLLDLKNKLKNHSVTKNCSDLSLFEQIVLVIFKKGMGNLKYLLPSDEGILQFLSYITEIWSRDQFFHENQLWWFFGEIRGVNGVNSCFLSDFLGVSYLQMAVIHSIFELGYWNFGNWKYSRATKTTLLCDFFICLVKNRAI